MGTGFNVSRFMDTFLKRNRFMTRIILLYVCIVTESQLSSNRDFNLFLAFRMHFHKLDDNQINENISYLRVKGSIFTKLTEQVEQGLIYI